MLQHTPKVRKVVYFLAFLSMGLGVSTLLISYAYLTYGEYKGQQACEVWLAETASDLTLAARVTAIERVSDCERLVSLNQNMPDQVRLCNCGRREKEIPPVYIGDSLHKATGTLYIQLFREGTSIPQSFSYPCCN